MKKLKSLLVVLLMAIVMLIGGCGSNHVLKYDSYREEFEATAYMDGVRISVDSSNKEKLFRPMVNDVFESVMAADKEKVENMKFTYDPDTNVLTEVESGVQYDFNADENPDLNLDDASIDYGSLGITGERGVTFLSFDKDEPSVTVFVAYKVYNEADSMDVTSTLTTVYTFK